MYRTLSLCVLIVAAMLMTVLHPAAQGAPDPWFTRQARPRDFGAPTVFRGVFSIELPKDWQFAPGHRATLFSVVEKTRGSQTGGLITLEHTLLQAALDPSLMATFSERELKDVQNRDPGGKQVTGGVKTGPAGPFVFVQYDRAGLANRDDRVVQYSIPVGTTLYRLICVAPTVDIDKKYRPIFAHVAASFTPIKPAGS